MHLSSGGHRARHPDWVPWYRPTSVGPGRRRLVRFLTASQLIAIRKDTFRNQYLNPKRTAEERKANNERLRQRERNIEALTGQRVRR